MQGRGSVLKAVIVNRELLRLVTAYGFFILTEYGVWIAILVYAYEHGGATTAGFVVLAQLVPASVVAPFLGSIADRRSPVLLLVGGYAIQGVALGAMAFVVFANLSPFAAYACAVVASTAVSATRPGQAALVPALVRTPDQLTAMNVICNWVESAGIVGAGGLTGIVLALSDVGLVFAGCSVLMFFALALVAPLRTPALAVEDTAAPTSLLGDVADGLRLLVRERHPRLLVILLALIWATFGALDVLFVVLAISVLHEGQAWAGYLNMAYGIGSVVAGALAVTLLGRRLGPPIVLAGLLLSVALGLTALSTNAAQTAALLGLTGLGGALLDMATRTLLQRSVPAQLLGRIFGVVEGVTMAALAAGSLLVPLFIHLGGTTAALVGVAAMLPLGLLLTSGGVLTLDAAARVPVVEIALLRSLPHFASLPIPALEGLARSLERVDLPAHAVVIRQGDIGDRFYAIAEGEVDISIDGRHVATRTRGDGLGEIALLRGVARSATVTAITPVTLYALDREPFLIAVTGHAGTHAAAERVADARLASDVR
jgi:MFS family permease